MTERGEGRVGGEEMRGDESGEGEGRVGGESRDEGEWERMRSDSVRGEENG